VVGRWPGSESVGVLRVLAGSTKGHQPGALPQPLALEVVVAATKGEAMSLAGPLACLEGVSVSV
jgi:hypothetical protein